MIINWYKKLNEFLKHPSYRNFLSLNYIKNFEHSHFHSVEALLLAPQIVELSLIKHEPSLLYVSPQIIEVYLFTLALLSVSFMHFIH
jgi:hypothetical protein